MPLVQLSASFQSLLPLPTIILGPSGADSWVGGFAYILGPCGCLQWTLLWGWEFLPLPPQPPQVFSISCLRLFFPKLELWVAWSVSLPSSSSRFICTRMWDRPVHNLLPCWVHQPQLCLLQSSSCHLSESPLQSAAHFRPSYRMNVSSLTPSLLDFHIVQFSVRSGCFFF